jgi:cell division protease FtsH
MPDDLDDLAEEFAEDEREANAPRTPRDPAAAAAEVMIGNTLAREPDLENAVRTEAAVYIIRTPSVDWNDVLCAAWLERFYQTKHIMSRVGKPTVVSGSLKSVVRAGSARHPFRDADLQDFADSVWQGKIVIGFSSAPEQDFPPEWITYGDYVFEIPELKHEDISEIVARLCEGDAGQQAFSGNLDMVTPLTLQLAYRPGRPADVYLQKLSKLCSRTAPATGGGSPREAPTLHRLHGMSDAVEWGLKLATDIAEYRAGRLPWTAIDNGLLLSGPPGVGKSLFARPLATSCDAPLILASYALWQSAGAAHLGTTLKAMRQSFADAKAKVPSILFIDEVDSFPNREPSKHDNSDYIIAVVNALLAELDGADSRTGVVVVAACNHPDLLDPSLVRSGRLDRHIRIELPDAADLRKILREHLGDDLAGQDLFAPGLLAVGASGADCERIVRGARRRARLAGRPIILGDLLQEISGPDDRPKASLYVAAIHEAGHAYAYAMLLPGKLEAVSLRRQGNSGGSVIGLSERGVLSSDRVVDLLRVLLSGRAAEHVLLGTPTSGAGGGSDSDLAQATRLAAHAATSFGFSEAMGLPWLGQPGVSEVPEALMADRKLARAVRAQLDEAYASAQALMLDGRVAVTMIAAALLDRRALSSDEVARIIKEASARASRQLILNLSNARSERGADAAGR